MTGRIPAYIYDQSRLEHLGKGSYGNVWKISDRRVLKITTDKYEIISAYWQAKHKHPQLVRVHRIYPLGADGYNEQHVAIVREAAHDYDCRDKQTNAAKQLERTLSAQNMSPYDVRRCNIGLANRHGELVPVVRDLGAISPPGGHK